MSTDQQQCSPIFQRQAIAHYAAAHSIRVVCDYEDAGISGLTLRARPALNQLLIDAADPMRRFTLVLVYDVSRWGRFQDIDESAFYEYMCRRHGVKVIYVAEPFEADASPMSPVMKTLKRVMAGEYSRELSRKVFLGHCILAELGNHVGGPPPYGYQRLLHDERLGTTRVLDKYEYKSIRTDRISLTPGPANHAGIVQKIFEWYAWHEVTCAMIAQRLNDVGILNGNNRTWLPRYIAQILHNPVYIGTGIYSRTSSKLAGEWHRVPEADWVSVPNAFPAIIDRKTFDAAQQRFANVRSRPSREALLDGLRKLVTRHGRVNQCMLRQYRRAPSVEQLMHEFGSLNAAYREIGYAPNLNPIREENRDREHRMEALVAHLTVAAFIEHGHTVTYEKHSLTLCVDHTLTFQVVVRAPWMVHAKTPYWSARWPDRFVIDFLVFCRMARDSKELLDFFVIPSGLLAPGQFATVIGPNARDFTMYRFHDLRVLLDLVANVSVMRTVRMLVGQSEKESAVFQDGWREKRHLLGYGRPRLPRPPRVKRVQRAMQQQIFHARSFAMDIEMVASTNRGLESALRGMLRQTGFVAVLADAGVSALPRLLVSRIIAKHSSDSSTSLTATSRTPDFLFKNTGRKQPESVPELTTKVLKSMSATRALSVMDLMERTACFAGDFALALLAATPDADLRLNMTGALGSVRLERRLARDEDALRKELNVIDGLRTTHQLELVELTLHLAVGRQLASHPVVQEWLASHSAEYLELLRRADVGLSPKVKARRSMRVAH